MQQIGTNMIMLRKSLFFHCYLYQWKGRWKLFGWGGAFLLIFFLLVCAIIQHLINCSGTSSGLGVQEPSDVANCYMPMESERGPSFRNYKYSEPSCSDITKTMVTGEWIERQYPNLKKDNQEMDDLLILFRTAHEGFTKYPFREDGNCGFKHQIQSSFCPYYTFDVSTWCDPRSDKPCCTSTTSGQCVTESSCISPHSVNLAKYVHAEVSDWIPHDNSCKMVTYTQVTACALLHTKRVRSIGFIGNSLMKNMYSLMLQMLQNNFHNGSVKACVPPSLRQKCVDHWQHMDKYCMMYAVPDNSRILSGRGMCNGYLDTLLYEKPFWVAQYGQALKQHVEELLDRPGTYLLVGIGVHDRMNADLIIAKYLKPTFDMLIGRKWPKFLWVHPLKVGLFKPARYISMHGDDDDIDRFVEKVDTFCEVYNIPTMDLRAVTTGVWSVDGTHYGTGINLMKVQLFLNFLASDEVF